MKVLLTLSDLYNNIGGGQAVYKKIIESSPNIEFSYLRLFEPENAKRPINAHAVPFLAKRALKLQAPPPHASYEMHALVQADAVARSVAGQTFDIVELPDFLTFGASLRDACVHHGVKVGRFVLSMHGNISRSTELNWQSSGRVLELKLLERRQFTKADGVYGISRRYIQHWQTLVQRHIYYIEPTHFVSAKIPHEPWLGFGRPSLHCIGRSERGKGNDIFVELVRWLNPASFAKAEHIGETDFSCGVSSAYLLGNIAKARGIDVPHLSAFSQDELAALYARSAIIVLPTRYDTLNLVALEALFSGCPIAISTCAGVCDYLDESQPHLPYLKLDLDNLYGNVRALRELIENYHDRRRVLHNALAQQPPMPTMPLDMGSVYGAILDAPAHIHDVPKTPHSPTVPTQNSNENVYNSAAYSEDRLSLRHRASRVLQRTVSGKWKRRLRPFFAAGRRRFIVNLLRESGRFGDAQYLTLLLDAPSIPRRLRNVGSCSESTYGELGQKLHVIYQQAASPLFRCNFWLDIARIQRLRGEDMIAAAYELRVLRLLGKDPVGILPRLLETLRSHSLSHEAQAVCALYSNPSEAPQRVYDLLKLRFEQLRHYNEKPCELIVDRRTGAPKVAVIVSLYKAAGKLQFFLTALAQQSLVEQGQVEIILVDSGSPENERSVFEDFCNKQPMNIVYARSHKRETIQAAWNRGIKSARAPYLVFLGVDESFYPEALQILAEELDRYRETDWVMANSLVTSVEENGLQKNDIMSYYRAGAAKDHAYLETCYLSWVGGMYRKTIHDRFGYYDETFRGAGDTEFKNRILPHINVRFIDRLLGIFLNYPDGQTTASPMAEIEDSRAWYLFRTQAGIRYAFEDRPPEDASRLLRLCLGYRKSYCRHVSTDIEYAALLNDYILLREPRIELSLTPGLHDMLEHLRRLEFSWKPPSSLSALNTVSRAWRAAQHYQKVHRAALETSGGGNPHYRILNDNRYEQHSWLWKTT